MNGDPVYSAAGIKMGRELQHTMLHLEKPVIAKVRGAAIGLGCTLAVFCDMVYATPTRCSPTRTSTSASWPVTAGR